MRAMRSDSLRPAKPRRRSIDRPARSAQICARSMPVGHVGCTAEATMANSIDPEPSRRAHPSFAPARPLAYIVDDDPSALELLRALAQDSGWAVRGFATVVVRQGYTEDHNRMIPTSLLDISPAEKAKY